MENFLVSFSYEYSSFSRGIVSSLGHPPGVKFIFPP